MHTEDFLHSRFGREVTGRERDELDGSFITSFVDGESFEHSRKPLRRVCLVHFDYPGACVYDVSFPVGDSASVELEIFEFIVEEFDHVIIEFLAGVGIWVDIVNPSDCSDVDRGDGMVTDPDVGGAEVGDDIFVALELVDAEGGASVEEAFFAETSCVTRSEVTKKCGSVYWNVCRGGDGREIRLAINRKKLEKGVGQ